jgi:hypothetical protein
MSTGNRRGKRKAKPPQVVLGIKALTADDTGLVKEVPAAGPTVAKTHRRFRQQDRKEEVHAMCFAPGEKQVLLGLANNAVETLNLEDGEKYVALHPLCGSRCVLHIPASSVPSGGLSACRPKAIAALLLSYGCFSKSARVM